MLRHRARQPAQTVITGLVPVISISVAQRLHTVEMQAHAAI
jgi:hypothetical protein